MNTGIIQCDGSCSASTPTERSGYGNSCTSSANSCGDTNTGTYVCSAGGGVECNASAPSERSGYGTSCQECNNIGQCNTGTNTVCTGGGVSCSVSAPPDNQPPSVSFGLDAVSEDPYCGIGTPPVFLSWNYSDPEGDAQGSYQVIIKQGGAEVVNTGQISSASTTYVPTSLSFSTTYSWQVKVWDVNGLASSLADGPGFTTEAKHPDADFTWTPTRPALDTEVQFTDQSTAYDGASITSYLWTFEFGEPLTDTQQNPAASFTERGAGGANAITLQVTDSRGNACTTQKSIQPTLPLPTWREFGPGQ